MNLPGRTVHAAANLGRAAPESVIRRLAATLLEAPGQELEQAARVIRAASPAAHFQRVATELVAAWRLEAPNLPPTAIAMALLGGDRVVRPADGLALVWTGPEVVGHPTRRTDQALIEVIDAASSELSIVSFIAYRVPRVRAAIGRAVARKVYVRIVVETPEESEGRVAYEGYEALVADGKQIDVFVWPRGRRAIDDRGNRGSLHAKFAVADDTKLFVSSANLTGHALSLTMEMGVLIEGGDLPRQAQERVAALIRVGELLEIKPV